MEEMIKSSSVGVANLSSSVARGGPIYVPNMVSSLTRVPDFKSTLLHELQNLKAELSSTVDSCNEDFSVDELKIFTDEELVDMALKEAFRDNENNGNCTQLSKDNVKAKKRRRKKANKDDVDDDESYLAKAEELAKIKEKQEQDKAEARLHSLLLKYNANESERIEKMTSLRSINSCRQVIKPSVDIQEYVPVQHPEVVLCIEVYHNVRKFVKTQEFLVLGRQTLTELRDKIYCLTDKVMQKAEQHDPSGYFLIEDVFCNDLRDPSAIDYSEPIFDWLRNSKDDALKKWEHITSGELKLKQKAVLGEVARTTQDLPQFRHVEMHKVRFCDLRFRLGAGYLYCHQGDCKHTIVLRDMRLIHPEDLQNRAAYPIVLFQMKFRAQKCNVCRIYRATKVTVDDKWAAENPCYFCNDCYYLLHHSQDGSLLYNDFLVYDYVHD